LFAARVLPLRIGRGQSHEDGVPESDPLLDGRSGGRGGLVPHLRVVLAEEPDHAAGHFTVVPPVEIDVTFEIILQETESGLSRGHQVSDEGKEHLGNHIFPTVGEDGGCFVQESIAGCIQGELGEIPHPGRNIRAGEGMTGGLAFGETLEEPVNGGGVGTGFLHGAPVEFEMAGACAIRTPIRFLPANDVIDQEPDFRITLRNPGKLDAGQIALQPFEQGHEIPDSEDMETKEHLDRCGAVNALVDRVEQQALAIGFNVDGNGVFEDSHIDRCKDPAGSVPACRNGRPGQV